MASQNIARLGIVLGMDSGELVTKITEAQQKFGKFKAQIKRDSEDAAKEIVRLEMATRNYGKTLTELEKVEEQIRLGKYKHQPEIIINSLKAQAAAYDKVAAAAKAAEQAKIGKAGGLTSQQQAALGYQTTDIITSLAGGQNPLMVMLQQGGQLRDQFGGFKPLFQGIAAAITPVGVAVTAVAGSVLGLSYAMYKGMKEQEAFNKSLVLTNNYAGVTAKTFDELSASISQKYQVSLGSSKEAMQAIVSSGKFTSATLESVGSLVARMSKLTGDSAKETADALIPMLDGSASSAKKLNEQYHFLSVEQYKLIRSLELNGEKQKAIKVTADALLGSLSKQTEELNSLGKAWDEATRKLDGYFQKFKELGKTESVDESIERLKNRISYLASGDQTKQINKDALEGAQEQLRLMQKMKTVEQEQLDAAAKVNEKREKQLAYEEKYGQQVIDLTAKIYEEEQKTKFAIAAKGLDEISQLELKKKMETELAKKELERKIARDPQIAKQLRDLSSAEEQRKIAELAMQQANVSRDELLNYTKKADAEQNSIDMERQRLDVYKQNLMASDADLQIALSRLKTEQQIAEIENNKKLEADPQGRAREIARLEQIQKAREAVINQAADLKMLQDMNQSVFNNMGSAIDNFVRTGKLSFKDLTKSIIQDLLSIAMRAQMMSMFKGFSFFGAGGSTGQAPVGDFGGPSFTSAPTLAANGADVQAGMPYYVGEQGPELFVPQGAGTIMPNKVVGAMTNNQPQIVYNGPYIQSMSAIDTQSATQFLAQNKTAVYAANMSAARSMPTSR